MRIVGGKYKGRRITVYKNLKARPTTDFAKENLFNILSNYFEFKKVIALDLFAGTGSISLEFASRGCIEVYTVEKDFRHTKFIKKVIQDLDIQNIFVFNKDVIKFITTFKNKFDIVFADPPYNMEGIDKLPDLIKNNQLVQKNGWFILEHSKAFNFTSYNLFREQRKYGSVHFSIFQF